jgi:hypothetical protein
LGLGRMSVFGALTAFAALCAHQAIACEMSQRPKPIHVVQPKRDVVATLQKRLVDLLRPVTTGSVPSRRIILQ